jgi:hypothetical protein
MKTQTSQSETSQYIQWTAETKISKQFKSLDEFANSDYLSIHAENFGYSHLVEREISRWSKYKVHNVFIVDADVEYNYGLDFKMYIHYTADGVNFFAELSLGASAITSSPLRRVMLTIKKPADLNLSDLQFNSKEVLNEWFKNMNEGTYESFCYSTNSFYGKGREYRQELRDLSKKSGAFIFA